MDIGSRPSSRENGSRPASRPPSRGPAALPKAPTSTEMARRLLANAEAKPVKRFDSADYFMNLAHSRSRVASATRDRPEQSEQSEQQESPGLECTTPPSTAPHVLLLPSPLGGAGR